MTVMNDWIMYYTEGLQLMKTAAGSLSGKRGFSPVIIYNISAIAIEKMYMALLIYHGRMPYGHALSDMAEAVRSTCGIDPGLAHDLDIMDGMQRICSFNDLPLVSVKTDDVPFILDVVQRVHDSVKECICRGGNE